MTRAMIRPVLGLLCGAMACASCGEVVTQGHGSSYLIIDKLQAATGSSDTAGATYGDTLQSDVRTNGSVFEDPGQVTLRLAMKDVTGVVGPTTNNEITVTRYHVRYTRSDGHNTQGVDVPYEFDGAVTGTVPGGQVATLTFVIVRAQAKLETPLSALINNGGAAKVISTIADVTLYGSDQTGNAVSVTGKIGINFADWADPEKTTTK